MKKKINKRAQMGVGGILIIVVVLAVIGAGAFWMGIKGTAQVVQPLPGDVALGGIYPQMTVSFDPDPLATDEQDSDADIDIDVFEVENVAGMTTLAGEFIVDCTSATPSVWDGKSTSTVMGDKAKCIVNSKLWAQDTNYNAGDSENEIKRKTSDVTIVKADMSDYDAVSNSTTILYPNTQYIVTITESASTDIEDCIMHAFLIEMPESTSLTDEQQKSTLIFKSSYWSDAVKAGKVTYGGDCEVGGSDSSLTSSLAGAIPASYGVDTAETNQKMSCNIEIEITKEGYCINAKNLLAEVDTDKGYIKAKQFGERYNSSTTGDWDELVLTGTDKIQYNTAPAAAGNFSLFTLLVGGIEITTSSDTDADENHNEKLYQDDVNFMENVCGKGAKIIIPVKLNDISKLNDSASAPTLATITADGGSEVLGSDQHMVNLTFITPLSTTDAISAVLKG